MVKCPYCGKEYPDIPERSENDGLVVVYCLECKNLSRVNYYFELEKINKEDETMLKESYPNLFNYPSKFSIN